MSKRRSSVETTTTTTTQEEEGKSVKKQKQQQQHRQVELFKKTGDARVLQDPQSREGAQLNQWQEQLVSNVWRQPGTFFQTEFISGPSSVSVHIFTDPHHNVEKTFLIFGEKHLSMYRHRCPKEKTKFIVDYMTQLAFETPCFLDFFLETYQTKYTRSYPISNLNTSRNIVYENMFEAFLETEAQPEYPTVKAQYVDLIARATQKITHAFRTTVDQTETPLSRSGAFYGLRTEFKPCLEPAPRQSELCVLMRSHYIDLRAAINETDPTNILVQFDFLEGVFIKKLDGLIKLLYLFHIDWFCEQLATQPDVGTWLVNWFVEKLPFLKKEVRGKEGKAGSYLGQEIEEFIAHFINKYAQAEECRVFFRTMFTRLKNPAMQNDVLDKFFYLVFRFMSKVVDLYCLARMFKDMDVSISEEPMTATNVVVYAGDAHASVYNYFIHYMYNCPNPRKRFVEKGYDYFSGQFFHENSERLEVITYLQNGTHPEDYSENCVYLPSHWQF